MRFKEAINKVGPGFRCEIYGETFLQWHDCLIHQFSTCLPSKGVRRTTKGSKEPGFGPQPTASVQPVDQPAHARHTTEENPSHQDENLENKIEPVWEA